MPISVPTFSRRRSGAGPTGLDLDGGYVSAVTLGDRAVAGAASAELPPGVIAEGEVRDAGALSDALRRFVKDHRLPKRVRLGVSNGDVERRQSWRAALGLDQHDQAADPVDDDDVHIAQLASGLVVDDGPDWLLDAMLDQETPVGAEVVGDAVL
jgi:hypothetical protein